MFMLFYPGFDVITGPKRIDGLGFDRNRPMSHSKKLIEYLIISCLQQQIKILELIFIPQNYGILSQPIRS